MIDQRRTRIAAPAPGRRGCDKHRVRPGGHPVRRLVWTTAVSLVLAVLLATDPVDAFAAWSGRGSDPGATTATRVATMAAPVVTARGTTAVVGWAAGALATGQPASGYVVRRTVGGTTTTICTATQALRSCTDPAPTQAMSSYTVAATFASWTGQASTGTSYSADVTAPTSTVSAPIAGKDYKLGNSGGNSWAKACSSGPGVCGTTADAGSGIASVTFSLTRSAPSAACWNGTAFVSGSCLVTAATTAGGWYSAIPVGVMSNGGSYAITITVTDAIGNQTTVNRVFTTST